MQAFANALDRLQEALAVHHANPLAIDGTIQRFEFTFELCWKTLKRVLEKEGVIAASPRDTLSKACQIKLLDDDKQWLEMLKDWNMAAHIYDEEQALGIYQRIKLHCPVLRKPCGIIAGALFRLKALFCPYCSSQP